MRKLKKKKKINKILLLLILKKLMMRERKMTIKEKAKEICISQLTLMNFKWHKNAQSHYEQHNDTRFSRLVVIIGSHLEAPVWNYFIYSRIFTFLKIFPPSFVFLAMV